MQSHTNIHTHKQNNPLRNYHTQFLSHTYIHTHTFSLSLFWQFCVSAKTTGTVDISLWLRFHSLWSQPCCFASLKGHRCCLSKSQQKHTVRCFVCVYVWCTHTHSDQKRRNICVFNLWDLKIRVVSQIKSIFSRLNQPICVNSRCTCLFVHWLIPLLLIV